MRNRKRVLNVGVNGSKGRMGTEVVRAVRAQADLNLVFETDVGSNLGEAILRTEADVVVDFTVPACALANTLTILEAGARPVVGTTGFRPDDLDVVRERTRALGSGAIIAPNFSVGAVLLVRFSEIAARSFAAAEIVELHHDGKLDAPSATAAATADRIAAARETAGFNAPPRPGVGMPSRGELRGDVCIHSVRLPGLVAHQEVLFGAPGQLLTIRHDAMSREAFMPGVLLAIRRAPDVRGLVYGLDSLLP